MPLATQALIAAGFGAIAPSFVKLSTYFMAISQLADGEAAPPLRVDSFLIACSIMVIVAVGLCLVMSEKRLKEAFFVGIAAPAIITGGISGLDAAKGLSGQKKAEHSNSANYYAASTSRYSPFIGRAFASASSMSQDKAANIFPRFENIRLIIRPRFVDKSLDGRKTLTAQISFLGESANPFKLKVDLEDGKSTALILPPSTEGIALSVPELSTRQYAFTIPPNDGKDGEYAIDVEIAVSSSFSSDLKWALGGNRELSLAITSKGVIFQPTMGSAQQTTPPVKSIPYGKVSVGGGFFVAWGNCFSTADEAEKFRIDNFSNQVSLKHIKSRIVPSVYRIDAKDFCTDTKPQQRDAYVIVLGQDVPDWQGYLYSVSIYDKYKKKPIVIDATSSNGVRIEYDFELPKTDRP